MSYHAVNSPLALLKGVPYFLSGDEHRGERLTAVSHRAQAERRDAVSQVEICSWPCMVCSFRMFSNLFSYVFPSSCNYVFKMLMPQVPSHRVPGILHRAGSLCTNCVQHPTWPSAKGNPTTHAALCRYVPEPPVEPITPEIDPASNTQVNWPCFACAPLLS